jgi:tripartite-type tricarboxylate transporter receptor subunit TctC
MFHSFEARPNVRRSLLAVCVLTTLITIAITWPAPAAGQSTTYPNKPVRIVLPLPPGTANDITLRMVADQLSKKWGQPVIVDNKPGASTIIGTAAVVKAPADGYTLLATISLLAQKRPCARSFHTTPFAISRLSRN